MSQSPPGSWLRLREADIVRFCGLTAAAHGLEIVAQHAVIDGHRVEGRLEASITGPSSTTLMSAEVSGNDPIAIHWYCTCRSMAEASASPPLACEHIAALLTTWIRDPSSFTTSPNSAPPSETHSHVGAGDESIPPPGGSGSPHASIAQLPLLKVARSSAEQHGEPTLADELAHLSIRELFDITRRVLGTADASPEGRRLLEITLRDPQKLKALIERLDHDAQSVLVLLLLLGGSSTSRDLDAIATRARQTPAAARVALEILERHAIIFVAPGLAATIESGDTELHPWRQIAGWRIPSEIRSAWKPPLPVSATPTRVPQGPPLQVSYDHTDAANLQKRATKSAPVVRASLRQLFLAFSLFEHSPDRFNPLHSREDGLASNQARGTVSTRKAQQTGYSVPFPLVPGDLSVYLASEFAHGAGISIGLAQMARRVILLGRETGSVRLILDLPRLPPEETGLALKNAFATWSKSELPMELADLVLPGSRLRPCFDQRHEALRPAGLSAEVFAARYFLLNILRNAEPGIWYAMSEFLELIWRLNPFFLRGRQKVFATPAWWLEQTSRRRPLQASVHEEWYEAEGEYIRAWFAGPLHWWGIFDLALTEGRQLAAFRLTPLGAYLLAADQADQPKYRLGTHTFPRWDWEVPVVVTPTSTLAVSPLAAGASLLDALANWAHPVAIKGGRAIYAFNAGLAAEAFDHNLTPDRLLSLLRTTSTAAGKRALAATQAQCDTWTAAYGRSSITTGWTLLEARDEATLNEALRSVPESARASLCRRLSPTHVLVPPELQGGLVEALRKHGYPL